MSRRTGTVIRGIVLPAVASLIVGACGASEPETTRTTPAGANSIAAPASECEPGDIDGELNLYLREGSLPESVLHAFEAEYETRVLADSYTDDGSVESKLVSGAAYDVVAAPSGLVGSLRNQDLIREIEGALAPNLGDIHPFFVETTHAPDPSYAAPFRWGTLGVGVDTGSITGEPSWSILFDAPSVADYQRGVALLEDGRSTMSAALMYLGYSPNTTVEAQLTEAAEVVAGLGDSVRFDSASHVEMLEGGGVDAALGWSASFADASETVAFLIPAEGTVVWIDGLLIPAAAEHVCTSHTFIDFVLDEAQGPALTDWSSYASTRVGAGSYVDRSDTDDIPAVVSNPAASLDILSDSSDLEDLYERYLALARR